MPYVHGSFAFSW